MAILWTRVLPARLSGATCARRRRARAGRAQVLVEGPHGGQHGLHDAHPRSRSSGRPVASASIRQRRVARVMGFAAMERAAAAERARRQTEHDEATVRRDRLQPAATKSRQRAAATLRRTPRRARNLARRPRRRHPRPPPPRRARARARRELILPDVPAVVRSRGRTQEVCQVARVRGCGTVSGRRSWRCAPRRRRPPPSSRPPAESSNLDPEGRARVRRRPRRVKWFGCGH